MKSRVRVLSFLFLAAACCLLFLARQAPAQAGANRAPVPADGDIRALPEKKRPSAFHRPATRLPNLQLEYAKQLLARGKTRRARKQFDALVRAWPNSDEAPAAQVQYASLLETAGYYESAFDEYQYAVRFFPGLVPFDYLLDRQYRIANYVMTARHGRLFFGGFVSPERALPFFKRLLQNAPNWSRAHEIRFKIGAIHEQAGDYHLAAEEYDAIERARPDSPIAEDARFRRAGCLFRISNSRPRDEATCRGAASTLAGFLADFPNSPNAQPVRRDLGLLKDRLSNMYYDRAVFYDRRRGNPKAALIAYTDLIRNFPESDPAARAAERIEILQKKVAAARPETP